MVMKIPNEAQCKVCRINKAIAQQDTMKCGFIIESYFCESCNETNPGYKPKIMEVYKLGQ